MQAEPRKNFTNAENAFVFAAYQISVFSMKKEDCVRLLGKDKSPLIHHYQVLFEQALARSNFLNTTNVTLLQAAGLYMVRSASVRISQSDLTEARHQESIDSALPAFLR